MGFGGMAGRQLDYPARSGFLTIGLEFPRRHTGAALPYSLVTVAMLYPNRWVVGTSFRLDNSGRV